MLIYTTNDPIPWFQQMHKESPVYYDPDISFYFGRKGAWQSFRHADVQKGMSDHALFSREYIPKQGVGLADGLGMTDPPRHDHLQSVISKAFVSTAIMPLEGWIRQECETLLGPGLKAGRMDFIQDFAHVLPIKVINHILGVPDQYLQQTLSWVTRIGGDPGENGPGTYATIQKEMIGLFTEVIEHKKQAPQDDLISYLLHARMEGNRLDMNEVISFCITIFTGGAESTTTLLGNAMLTFAERPELQEHLLRHPGDIPNALLEVLRFRCPVLSLPRIAKQDLQLSGQQIRKGDLVNFWIAAANLDPEIFPSPAVFDIHRDNSRIMTFGHGIYHCLGKLLAKLEARLAFETVFRHLRNIRIARENVLSRIPNIVFFRFQSLLITFDAAKDSKVFSMPKKVTDEQFYAGLQHLPKPQYPFPDFIHPDFEQQRQEYYAWIDQEYTFHSKAAREKHKSHNLTDIAARGCPFLDGIEALRPLANFAANGAMMDDYWDRCSYNEMNEVTKRITALLTGEDMQEPADNGIFRQFWVLRQDAIKCGMPERLYEKYVASIHSVLVGYAEERIYYRANVPPPLPIYLIIRLDTSGGLPFCKYVAMQKNYRNLPDSVLEHPFILRLHNLCAWMIGMHNDCISLPKELHREGDTMNIVKVMQHEHQLPLKEAYMMALDLHDSYLKEFLLLKENLPPFGDLQDTVSNYVEDLGIMIAGVYAWHTNDKTRYVNGGYVDGEYVSQG